MKKKIFVIGDSISWYYGQYLSKMILPFADYDRKGGSRKMTELADMTDGVNGGHSGMVLIYLKGILNETFFTSATHLILNCGIHDVKRKSPGEDCQIPLAQYRRNLEEILDLAPIPVIWITTTSVNPIAENAGRGLAHQADIECYNHAAEEIMQERHIPVIDLNAFTRSLGPDIYLNHTDNVHFNPETQEKQAAFLCGALSLIL